MLRFLWIATRGYRLRPWMSPYLRWRMETYSGIPSDSIDKDVFFRFLWTERASLWQYLRWVGRMHRVM
jgi:hypothetical protein